LRYLQHKNSSSTDELNRKLEFDVTAKELQRALTVFEEVNQEAKGKLETSEKELMEELERIRQTNNDCDRRDDISFCPNEVINGSKTPLCNETSVK